MSLPTASLSAALANRYRIERHLGAGGMATVYLAQDLKHDRQVALKVLKPELAAVLGAERFVVEIKTTAALQHPHILPLFDSGTADGFLYYVMPFIDGETLRDKLNRETQFGIEEAVRIATDVAGALDYAHRHGVIHRDIKPENILLHDGRPMVADFGIALALSAAAGGRMTETGLSLGTPHYMSPEQATAEKEISARSDVYSLGSVLYEMLAGAPPHTGVSAQQIIMKIIAEPVEAVTKFRKSVPPNVAAAVAKSLEKLPADRFESAKAFGDALMNPAFSTMSATGVGAGAGMMGGRAGTSPQLSRATAALAAVAVVAAVWGWARPTSRAEVSRFAIVLPDSQALAQNVTGLRLAVSPDGREIVYVGPGASVNTTRLWLRRLDQLNAVALAGTEGAINPSFSPDGKRLAFVAGSPRALKTIALAGGPALTLTDSVVDNGGVSWGFDGYIYYDGKLEGDGLARVRESGGVPPEIATRPDSSESWHAVPAALPNGRGVLFSISRNRGASFDVGVVDTRTGKHRVLVQGAVAKYAASGHLVYVTEEGTLMAAPFDADRLEISGDAIAVAAGLGLRSLARADLAISDGGLLVYSTGSSVGGVRELAWVARDGTATPVDSAWSRVFAGRPTLSPDGRSAAVMVVGAAGLPQLWVKQLDRGPASMLSEFGYSPSWTPDGKRILFATDRGLSQGPADGSLLPAPIRALTARVATSELSPDGKWVVYSVRQDLFAIRTDGDTSTVELVVGPSISTRFAVSPDGRYLAYVSDETGRNEVYVRPFPDTKSAKWSVSVAGGNLPRWSRDGRELFFIDERLDLIAVPVSLRPTFSAGIQKRLFPTMEYNISVTTFDMSRDGARFLMTRPAGRSEASTDEIVLVQNFFEELREKVKP